MLHYIPVIVFHLSLSLAVSVMSQPKTYFLVPDFDCPPGTAIRLGHIITFPTSPYESLNADKLIPVPDEIAVSSSKSGFSTTRSQVRTGKFGVWAQILEGAYGGGLGLNLTNSQDGTFAIDEVQTTFLKPTGLATKSYIRQSLEVEGVKEYFEGSRFRKSVYMILGLKIAKGAKFSIATGNSKEAVAKLMIDGTAAGMPYEGGTAGGDGSTERRGNRVER
jgi:hypothetical protein